MACVTRRDANRPPRRIPGYGEGPFTHRPGLLDEPLFWLDHISSCARTEEAEELLFGADFEAAEEFHRDLYDAADWPVFTVPLRTGHRLHVVQRTLRDDPGTDYLLHHPDWDGAAVLASDEGHFIGPGLSWPELAAASHGGVPGGSTGDPHARLLLLLPALGDDELPDTASAVLAEALMARTAVDDPHRLAALLLEDQGWAGPSHWTTAPDGTRTDNGRWSRRNPANRFAYQPCRLTEISAALALPPGAAASPG